MTSYKIFLWTILFNAFTHLYKNIFTTKKRVITFYQLFYFSLTGVLNILTNYTDIPFYYLNDLAWIMSIYEDNGISYLSTFIQFIIMLISVLLLSIFIDNYFLLCNFFNNV